MIDANGFDSSVDCLHWMIEAAYRLSAFRFVELNEGGQVDARIEGVDPLKPETIRIGMPLEAAFIHRKDVEVPETCLALRAGLTGRSKAVI